MEIVFDPVLNRYQLILPEAVVKELGLFDDEENALGIFHSNKMNLEWLYSDIMKRHAAVAQLMQLAEKRRKRKLIMSVLFLLIAFLLILFKNRLAKMTAYPPAGLNLIGILVAIFSVLFFIQNYFLKGIGGRKGLAEGLKTMELQTLIQENFSK